MIWSKEYESKQFLRLWERDYRFHKKACSVEDRKAIPEIQKLTIGEARRLKAAILFVDIVSFTERSQYVSSEELLFTLNLFLSEMTQIVEDFGGWVEKYTGDGLMAVFDTSKIDEHVMVQRAIDAATTMRHAIDDDINYLFRQKNITPLEYRISIDGGNVLIGKVGIRGNNELSTIGVAANIASKLQDHALANSITLGGYIYYYLTPWEKLFCSQEPNPDGWGFVFENNIAEPYAFYSYDGKWKYPVSEGGLASLPFIQKEKRTRMFPLFPY